MLLHEPFIRVAPSADQVTTTVYIGGAVFVSDPAPAYASMPTLSATLAD